MTELSASIRSFVASPIPPLLGLIGVVLSIAGVYAPLSYSMLALAGCLILLNIYFKTGESDDGE